MTDSYKLWERFKNTFLDLPKLGFSIDISRVNFDDKFLAQDMGETYRAMDALVGGKIANPDEQRMVGHYWLRNPELAPTAEIRLEIEKALQQIRKFSAEIHAGKIQGSTKKNIRYAFVIGIGGSALGPQFVDSALGSGADPVELFFADNTDPDGLARVIGSIPSLSEAICIVISKSGGTKETRNGQFVAKKYWAAAGLSLSDHFVAVTGAGSELDQTALREKWLAIFPMWDWIGGRTSELSAVGLLPAALQGIDIDEMLRGARDMDHATIASQTAQNPAALLALMWFHLGDGRGSKDMVVLPYKDRLEMLSKYLQQLVMESLGKERDLNGKLVNQGIAVYGNKGSTDQHAYVQQLRDGVNNFFAVFIEVLKDDFPQAKYNKQLAQELEVEPGITCGDYLSGFLLGTRRALFENGRQSITLTISQVNAYSVGQLIALFERAVGFYASLVNINAYHQPGVEAGKKAAAEVLQIQSKLMGVLEAATNPQSLEQLVQSSQAGDVHEIAFKILSRLTAEGRVKRIVTDSVFNALYATAS